MQTETVWKEYSKRQKLADIQILTVLLELIFYKSYNCSLFYKVLIGLEKNGLEMLR
jgi:hypothetical protein